MLGKLIFYHKLTEISFRNFFFSPLRIIGNYIKFGNTWWFLINCAILQFINCASLQFPTWLKRKGSKIFMPKISKNSQDTVHLETLKVSETVHKLLLDDLRKKNKLWIKIWEGLRIRKGSVLK